VRGDDPVLDGQGAEDDAVAEHPRRDILGRLSIAQQRMKPEDRGVVVPALREDRGTVGLLVPVEIALGALQQLDP
jgi:hypothetical protein